ncbi:cytochrome P450 [Streptomyces radicis]|uniref:Cytochrome P450 n=1 Tax=Streptomyces radicis TaxID=1750517 RepID=A0A3A9W4X1_9ACTN|nr:cytochrome P450 [Streptomyces radicis]RKN07900.1 cytochrome P450 [Streptomyces radicis]RKN20646.1 cytochrome P450 [Streptomyces radicis]
MTTEATRPVPLYGPDYAADPYAVFDKLREFGACAPVELAPGVVATLVIGYRAALEVLQDPGTYSKDPRVWQHNLPPDSPVAPMMTWRQNLLFNDGEVHARYRRAINDSFALIEPFELRDLVHRLSDSLIRGFADRGEADLLAEYARTLPLLIFNALFGMSDEYSERVATAMAAFFDAESPEAANRAITDFDGYLRELVELKKKEPGQDLTSWLLEHPVELTDQEVIDEIMMTMSAGHEPTTNLIANALARMLSDDRYYRTVSSGALTATDAITDVLWNNPPMLNFSTHFPRRDVDLHGTWIQAGTPVLISYAAANTAPSELPAGPRSDTGAHLSFAAGPHACPAKQPAVLIAATAIDRLTSWLCDIRLTVPYDQLTWRPGPFHRALTALPARFTPIAPDQKGTNPWHESRSSSTPPPRTSPET